MGAIWADTVYIRAAGSCNFHLNTLMFKPLRVQADTNTPEAIDHEVLPYSSQCVIRDGPASHNHSAPISSRTS